ncbi:MAG: DUF3108 domain-containing protein [Gammaproteobacteria bacterium]
MHDIIIACGRNFTFTCCVLLLISTFPVAANDNSTQLPLESFHATYSITISGVKVGKLERDFYVDKQNRYTFKSESKATGIAALLNPNVTNEMSSGYLRENQLIPIQYDFVRTKGNENKRERVRFDHENQSAHTQRKGVEQTIPLAARSLDQLSYQLQLMVDLLREKKTISYAILTAKKSKQYAAQIAATEKVSIAAGEFLTIRLSEQNQSPDSSTTFWCAKSLNYLPVKVQIIDGSLTTTIALSKYSNAQR